MLYFSAVVVIISLGFTLNGFYSEAIVLMLLAIYCLVFSTTVDVKNG